MSPSEKKDSVQLTGKVTTGIFAKGSKSEYEAVYLNTEKGAFVLRRAGENPFEGTTLQKLVGKNVSAKGTVHNNIFFVDEINVVK